MKKNRFRLLKLFILGFAAVYLVSCSGGDKHLRVLPEDANMLVSFNVKKLASKADIKELKETDFFEEEVINDNETLQEMIEKPAISGINFSKDVFFYTFEDETQFTGLVFALKNKKKFEEFLEDYMDEKDRDLDIEEEDDYSWAKTGYSSAIAWDNKLGVILNGGYLPGGDDDLEDIIEEMMTGKVSNSVLKSDLYKELKKIGKDVNLVVDLEETDQVDYDEIFKNIGMDDEFEVKFSEVGIEFNKGEVKMESKAVYSDDTEELLKEYEFVKGSPDKGLLNILPGEDVIGALSLSLKPEKIVEFVKNQENWSENIGNIEEQLDMDLDEIAAKIKGDVVFVVHNMKKDYYYKPIYSFAVSLNNDDILDDFLDMLEKQGMEIEETDGYYNFRGMYIGVKDNTLFGTNDEEYAKEIADGPDENLGSTDIGDDLTKSSFNLAVNLNLDKLPEETLDYIKEETDDFYDAIEPSSDLLNIGSIHSDLHKGEVKIGLNSKKKNSLALIMAAVAEAYDVEE